MIESTYAHSCRHAEPAIISQQGVAVVHTASNMDPPLRTDTLTHVRARMHPSMHARIHTPTPTHTQLAMHLRRIYVCFLENTCDQLIDCVCTHGCLHVAIDMVDVGVLPLTAVKVRCRVP